MGGFGVEVQLLEHREYDVRSARSEDGGAGGVVGCQRRCRVMMVKTALMRRILSMNVGKTTRRTDHFLAERKVR